MKGICVPIFTFFLHSLWNPLQPGFHAHRKKSWSSSFHGHQWSPHGEIQSSWIFRKKILVILFLELLAFDTVDHSLLLHQTLGIGSLGFLSTSLVILSQVPLLVLHLHHFMLEYSRTLSLVSSIYTYFIGDVIQSHDFKYHVYKNSLIYIFKQTSISNFRLVYLNACSASPFWCLVHNSHLLCLH